MVEAIFQELPDSAFAGADYYSRDWDRAFRDSLIRFESARAASEGGFPFFTDRSFRNDHYLKFSTHGDGAGMYFEMKVFEPVEMPQIIVIVRTDWAMCCSVSDFWVYRRSAPREFEEIGEFTMPKFRLADFYRETDLSKVPEEEFNSPPIQMFLPQKGQEIHVILDFGAMEYEMSEETMKIVNEEPAVGEIVLKWNGEIFAPAQ